MEELFLRFPHLSEKIFDNLNNGSLSKSREISKSWNLYLSDEKWYEIRILKAKLDEICPEIGQNVRKITSQRLKEIIRNMKRVVCQFEKDNFGPYSIKIDKKNSSQLQVEYSIQITQGPYK